MKRIAAVLSTFVLAASVVVVAAQEDVIKARQELMKSNGQALGTAGKMAKGEIPFDAAAATAAFDTVNENAMKFDAEALFPTGSETGGETAASPKIWEDMAGFKAKADEWKAAAAKAAEADIADVAALQATLGGLGQACGACHETYRLKKD